MCGRSSECNLQDLFVLFPQHGLRSPAAVWENDRTRAATEIKPNHNENIHFVLCKIYFCVRGSGAKCKQTKIKHTSRFGKNKHIIDTAPPTPLEFPIPSVGEVWIFSGTTQY